jgi:L-2-hydroxycarboxylate dehydrogenase (NAD+)
MLPGQLEAQWAKRCEAAGGLLFTEAEVTAFNEIAAETGSPRWSLALHKTVVI